MILPIEWNQESDKWEVKDKDGNVLHAEEKYVDAAEWAANYVKQQAFNSVILTGSARG